MTPSPMRPLASNIRTRRGLNRACWCHWTSTWRPSKALWLCMTTVIKWVNAHVQYRFCHGSVTPRCHAHRHVMLASWWPLKIFLRGLPSQLPMATKKARDTSFARLDFGCDKSLMQVAITPACHACLSTNKHAPFTKSTISLAVTMPFKINCLCTWLIRVYKGQKQNVVEDIFIPILCWFHTYEHLLNENTTRAKCRILTNKHTPLKKSNILIGSRDITFSTNKNAAFANTRFWLVHRYWERFRKWSRYVFVDVEVWKSYT